MMKTQPRRVDFNRQDEDYQAYLYACLGFSTKFIKAMLPKLTESQINYRLQKAKVTRSQYRNGENSFAHMAVEELTNPHSSLSELKRLERQHLAKQLTQG